MTRRAAQWFSGPCPHHPSHGRLGLKVTGVPIARPVTPEPTASIHPLASCPMTIPGIRRPDSPVYPWRSEPQMPT